jgi:hypothetical protein
VLLLLAAIGAYRTVATRSGPLPSQKGDYPTEFDSPPPTGAEPKYGRAPFPNAVRTRAPSWPLAAQGV